MVTSAGPAEGKSFVAMNLALAFAAEREGDVLLLDADLRRPSIARWIAPAPKVGLAELLAGRTEFMHALLELGNCPLHVLPAGEPPGDPLAPDAAGRCLPAGRPPSPPVGGGAPWAAPAPDRRRPRSDGPRRAR